MSDEATGAIPASIVAPSSREGQLAGLDLFNWRDLALLGKAIRSGWIASIRELLDWQDKLTEVRQACDEDKTVIAATAVQATVVKALADSYTKAQKAAEGQANTTNNTQINNTIDLSGLTVEQLRALAGGGDGA